MKEGMCARSKFPNRLVRVNNKTMGAFIDIRCFVCTIYVKRRYDRIINFKLLLVLSGVWSSSCQTLDMYMYVVTWDSEWKKVTLHILCVCA